MSVVSSIATDNSTAELVLKGYIKGLYPKRLECAIIRTDSQQYPQYILHLGRCDDSSVSPRLAEGEDLLREYLEHIQTWSIYPQVAFKVAAGSKAVYDVRWLCEDEKTLLLPLPHYDLPTWLVLQSGKAPFTTTSILNRSLPSGRLFTAQQYWCVELPDVTVKAAFLLQSQAPDWFLLKSRPYCGELLAQNADHEHVSRYLAAITAECAQFVKEDGCWGHLEQQYLQGLDATLQQVIRRALLKQLADDQLTDAWSAPSNRQLIKELQPTWARRRQQEDATRKF